MDRIIGVLGGMGPEATADAFLKLIANTPAKKDQEHIPVIIASLPAIPDRTENILYGGPSPLPAMIKSLKVLENSGASCIVMPCNTAHYWLEELRKNTASEFISIIESACDRIIAEGISSVALVATTATVKTKLYQRRLEKAGISCIIPDVVHQEEIMKSIIAFKRGEHRLSSEIIASSIKSLQDKGCEKIIMGCTEIPLILESHIREKPQDFIDATDELIKRAVQWYYR
ncbi:aspartate/glutamate racemase family protein [Enterobacter cloacae]|uniref:aspartate/glutamate racemase family protein n=1 Tax=Enterobacter cloacae TaxID=550 RepID=UPI0032DBE87A